MRKICVFCTLPSDSGGRFLVRSSAGKGTIHQFQKQVLREGVDWKKKTHEVPDHWTICGECRPPVEAVVGATEKVTGLEEKVRKLQTALLIELRRLWAEVEFWKRNVGEVEQLMRRGEEERRKKEENLKRLEEERAESGAVERVSLGRREELEKLDEKVERFREKTFDALGKLGDHGMELSTSKLMQGAKKLAIEQPPPPPPRKKVERVVPPPKAAKVVETDKMPVKQEPVDQEAEQLDQMMMEAIDDDWNDDAPASSPPSPPGPSRPVATVDVVEAKVKKVVPADDLDEDDDVPLSQRIPKTKPRRRHKKISKKRRTDYGLSSDSSATSSSEYATDNSSDEDFNPEDLALEKYVGRPKIPDRLRKQSTFLRNFICRLQQHNNIPTSKYLPPDPQDPRRNYYIWDRNRRFFIDTVEILVLDQEESLKCSLCDYKTPPATLPRRRGPTPEEHIFEHVLGIHLNAYHCPQCDLTYKDKSCYFGHMRGVHEQAYVCPTCARPCSSTDSLRTHQWTHLNAEERQLPENAHMMPYSEKHKERLQQQSFQCSECGKVFRRKEQLQQHMEVHVPKEQREKVICEQCGSSLLAHSVKNHKCPQERYKICLVCQEKVKNVKTLWKHLKKMHPEEKLFHCEECGRGFTTKPDLGTHVYMAHKNQKFMCRFCGAALKRKSNLKRHESKCGPRHGIQHEADEQEVEVKDEQHFPGY